MSCIFFTRPTPSLFFFFFFLMIRRPPRSTLFPYTTLFRSKRVSFLSSAVRELALENVRVVSGRVEDCMDELEGRFDAVVMRCAGDPGQLLPIAARLLRRGGTVAASGPPKPRPLPVGDWITVVTRRRGGKARRFAVYRNS